MRNAMPKRCHKTESGIINLDSDIGSGTHWCAYYKKDRKSYYFDSFGNLQPPKEFLDYVGSQCTVFYNYKKYQHFNTFNCGNLCLEFLLKMSHEN